jgi:hypothetical protein
LNRQAKPAGKPQNSGFDRTAHSRFDRTTTGESKVSPRRAAGLNSTRRASRSNSLSVTPSWARRRGRGSRG